MMYFYDYYDISIEYLMHFYVIQILLYHMHLFRNTILNNNFYDSINILSDINYWLMNSNINNNRRRLLNIPDNLIKDINSKYWLQIFLIYLKNVFIASLPCIRSIDCVFVMYVIFYMYIL